MRTIAVGVDSSGRLFVGSSDGFGKAMITKSKSMGIRLVGVTTRGSPLNKELHAEENLMKHVTGVEKDRYLQEFSLWLG